MDTQRWQTCNLSAGRTGYGGFGRGSNEPETHTHGAYIVHCLKHSAVQSDLQRQNATGTTAHMVSSLRRDRGPKYELETTRTNTVSMYPEHHIKAYPVDIQQTNDDLDNAER